MSAGRSRARARKSAGSPTKADTLTTPEPRIMPSRIDALTSEQTTRFGEWRRKWIGIGLSTEPADFEAASAAALACYDLIGRKRPTVILRMGSPFGACIGGPLAIA